MDTIKKKGGEKALSEKFKKEYELRDHIAENFSQFFDFTFVGKEFHIGKKRVDLAGEDDKTFYLIELKKTRVYRSAINQMEKYISLYKTQSTKAVRGILVAPKISTQEEAYINSRENLKFLRIEGPFIESGKDYVIRNIDDDIYEAFRIKAIMEHRTIREILIEFIELYIQDKVKLGEKS